MSMSAQIKALDESKGIQHLLDAAYEVLQNPIAMFDTTYALQAHTDITSDDPLWNELVTTGTFSMETQVFFANECFTEEVANADRLVVLKSAKLAYDRILCNVFNRDMIKVANVIIVESNQPFGEEEPAALMELTDKISRIIREDEYYSAYGRASHQAMIRDLLDGRIRDPLIHAPHVQILYEGFNDYLYVAVVSLPQGGNPQDTRKQFYDLLTSAYPSFKFAVYGDDIVMLMSSKHSSFDEKLFFDVQNNPFKENNLFVGISSSFENLYLLREHYDNALAAREEGLAANDGRRVFHSG